MNNNPDQEPEFENPLLKFQQQARASAQARRFRRAFSEDTSPNEVEDALRPIIARLVQDELRMHGIMPTNDPG